MAFLLLRAAKQGYQAHRDLNSPTPPEERLDRHGRPKRTGAVYNLVQGAERAYQQRQQQQQNGAAKDHNLSEPVNEEVGYPDTKQSDRKDDKALDAIDAPPSYEVATASPHTQFQSRGVNGASGFGNASTAAQYAPPATSGSPPLSTKHAAPSSNNRRDSSSSSSSSSSDSSRDYQNYAPRGLARDQYRAQKREYKLARRQFKREQRELKRYNRDEYRARKREMRSSIFGVPPAASRS